MSVSTGTTFLAVIVMVITLAICPLNGCAKADAESIKIDDMRNANLWFPWNDTHSTIDVLSVADGLKISYDLKEKNAEVSIARDIDFANTTNGLNLNKLLFNYSGKGASNTLCFDLAYKDGANFRYARNNATDTSAHVPLSPSQITYWWGGKQSRSQTEPVNFNEVKRIGFAISNNPDKGDILGKGFVIISSIDGEAPTDTTTSETSQGKKDPPQPWWQNPMIMVAFISGLFALAIAVVRKWQRK